MRKKRRKRGKIRREMRKETLCCWGRLTALLHPALKANRLSIHSVNSTQTDSHTKAKSVN